MPIRAVSFDFHGTLAVPWPSPGAVYATVAKDFGLAVSAADLDQHFSAAFQAVRKSHLPAYGSDESDARDFWFAVIRACFTKALPDHPPLGEPLCMALFAAFGKGSSWQLLPEVRGCLDWCVANDLAMVVCSNFDARVHHVIRDLNLGPFAEVLPSTLVGLPKPDPELLLLAISLLELEPEEMLHVGDNPHEDGHAAQAAGCPWYPVDPRYGPRLSELKEQIALYSS